MTKLQDPQPLFDANAPHGDRDLGPLPEWDLTDLYPAPDAPELYHLVINTSDVDPDYAADLVIEAESALRDGTLPPRVGTPA